MKRLQQSETHSLFLNRLKYTWKISPVDSSGMELYYSSYLNNLTQQRNITKPLTNPCIVDIWNNNIFCSLGFDCINTSADPFVSLTQE